MKIDTEGCELFVLKGAEKTIRRDHPEILLEYNEINCKQFSYKPIKIKQLLARWGYSGTILHILDEPGTGSLLRDVCVANKAKQ